MAQRFIVPIFLKSIVVATSLMASGCLSDVHRVPRKELVRIAQTAPAERGKRVRVVQQLAGDDGPPDAPVAFRGGIWVSVPVQTSVVRGRSAGRAANADSDTWRVLAIIAAAGLVFTEGLRYDGWAGLHPGHPVHLYFGDGGYAWKRLDELDLDTAMAATRAYVRTTEGPFKHLGRAPLNRQGFHFGLLMGATDIPRSNESDIDAFSTHIQFGFFPHPAAGLLFDFAFANADDGDAVFDSRSAFELQLFPVDLGILHAGFFTQIGLASRLDDGRGSDRSDWTWGAGPLLQLELTTRLAITGRAGWHQVHDEMAQDFVLGVSVY